MSQNLNVKNLDEALQMATQIMWAMSAKSNNLSWELLRPNGQKIPLVQDDYQQRFDQHRAFPPVFFKLLGILLGMFVLNLAPDSLSFQNNMIVILIAGAITCLPFFVLNLEEVADRPWYRKLYERLEGKAETIETIEQRMARNSYKIGVDLLDLIEKYQQLQAVRISRTINKDEICKGLLQNMLLDLAKVETKNQAALKSKFDSMVVNISQGEQHLQAVMERIDQLTIKIASLLNTDHEEDGRSIVEYIDSDEFMLLLDNNEWEEANEEIDILENSLNQLLADPELQEAFDLLGLVPYFTKARAKKAKRALAKRFHPRKLNDKDYAAKEEMMKKINAAYAIILKKYNFSRGANGQ